MHILTRTTVDQVRQELAVQKNGTIYYGACSCWWTHDPSHLSTLPPPENEVHHAAVILRLNSNTPDAPLEDFYERALAECRGLPCDPCRGVLLQTDQWEQFLTNAEQYAHYYGRHRLRAFMAAHHNNCVVGYNHLYSFPGYRFFDLTPTCALDIVDDLTQKQKETRV